MTWQKYKLFLKNKAPIKSRRCLAVKLLLEPESNWLLLRCGLLLLFFGCHLKGVLSGFLSSLPIDSRYPLKVCGGFANALPPPRLRLVEIVEVESTSCLA